MNTFTGTLQLFAMLGIVVNNFCAFLSILGSFILLISAFFTSAPLRKFGEFAYWSMGGFGLGAFLQICMLITGTMPEKIGFLFPLQSSLVSGLFVLSFLLLMVRFWLQRKRMFAFSVPYLEKKTYKATSKPRGGNTTNIYVGHDVVGNVVVGDNNKVDNSAKIEIKQQLDIDTRNALDIWAEVKRLKGQTLRTLDQHKPFLVVEITDHIIIVRPLSTKKDRPISREGIEAAMLHLKTTGQLTSLEIEEQFVPYNPVYVSAILASFPEVQHSIRPIRLWTMDKN